MRALVLNKHTGAIGLPGGLTLPPGETATVDLSEDELVQLKGWEYVEVSDLDRPPSSGNKKPAKGG